MQKPVRLTSAPRKKAMTAQSLTDTVVKGIRENFNQFNSYVKSNIRDISYSLSMSGKDIYFSVEKLEKYEAPKPVSNLSSTHTLWGIEPISFRSQSGFSPRFSRYFAFPKGNMSMATPMGGSYFVKRMGLKEPKLLSTGRSSGLLYLGNWDSSAMLCEDIETYATILPMVYLALKSANVSIPPIVDDMDKFNYFTDYMDEKKPEPLLDALEDALSMTGILWDPLQTVLEETPALVLFDPYGYINFVTPIPIEAAREALEDLR